MMNKLRTWVSLFVAAALSAPLVTSVGAASSTIVISEFRVRGPNGGNDEFIELHNLSTVDVAIGGWLVRGSNASGTVSTRATVSPGIVLEAGCFYLLANSGASGYSAGVMPNQTYGTGITDDGGIAVALPDGTIVDQVGMSSGSFYKEGTPLATLGSGNQNRGYERRPGGASGHADTDDNASDFHIAAPSVPRNLSSPCIGDELRVQGAAAPNPVPHFADVLITAAVTPAKNPSSTALSVVADLTSLNAGVAQPLYDDGTNGDKTANDQTFSYLLNVASSPGTYAITVNAADSELRNASHSFSLQVVPPPVVFLPHDVQGDSLVSPLVNATVTVEGVVTGVRSNGLFVQTVPGSEDANFATSEGLFVFTGGAPDAAAAVGTVVHATGMVVEYSGDGYGVTLTELTNSPTIAVRGVSALPAPVTLTTALLSPSGGIHQLEPLESMLVAAPSLTTTSGTDGSFSAATGGEASGVMNSNGVFFAVLSGSDRPVREPGLDLQIAATFAEQCASGPPCSIPVFDANPERLRVDSDALGAPRLDVTAKVVITDMIGIIDSGFLAWGLLPTPQSPGVSTANIPGAGVAPPTATQFTVASFNMQRFFDTVNDSGVSDVPLTAANFNNRLTKASLVIRTVLHMPDVLAVQEVENLGVLQSIAERVNADAGMPGEYTAYLSEGNDPGGIDVGFLVRSRVHVASVTQVGKDTLLINPATGEPYTDSGVPQRLNDRPPLVLRGTVDGPASRLDAEIIVVANHLRSLNGVDDAAPRVRQKRQQQAEFLATLLDDLQEEGRVISVGDYNAFEFSDGLVDVMGTVIGDPTVGDQVVIASPDVTEPNFLFTAPGVYSYVFEGNAQTLDHVIVSRSASDIYAGLQHARINADFPEIYRNDPSRIERLSDHDPAVAYFEFPQDTVAPVVFIVPSVTSLWPPNHELVAVSIAIEASDNLAIGSCGVSGVSSSEAANATGDGNTDVDWIIDGPTRVRLRAERSGSGPGRVYTVTVTCVDVAGNIGTATTTVGVPHDKGKKK